MNTTQIKRKFAAGAFLALLALAGTSPVALAEERQCSGSLGAVTVDNLRVPANATCTLTGTQIAGVAAGTIDYALASVANDNNCPGNYVMGANLAAYTKVADAMVLLGVI